MLTKVPNPSPKLAVIDARLVPDLPFPQTFGPLTIHPPPPRVGYCDLSPSP